MFEDSPGSGESDFERRKFMKALGVGAGVSGLAGLGSAEDTLSVVESEPISSDRAAYELDAARGWDYYNWIAEFMSGGSLDPIAENVWGHRIVTDDEEFNEREPVILSLPYAGPEGSQQGFLWVTMIDDAEGRRRPNGGVGTTVETVDDEDRHRIYGWEDGEPAILASEPVESSTSSIGTQSHWCSTCVWVVDVTCYYGLYTLGRSGCNYICWSYTCQRSCEALVDWLSGWLCNRFDSEQICDWAGFC